MVTPSQATHVIALVRERHDAVRQSFDRLMNAYATGQIEAVAQANQEFRDVLSQLQAVVASQHWPDWLKDLVLNADRYAARHGDGLPIWRAHLNSAMRHGEQLINEDWSFSDEKEVLLDVDKIIESAREEFRVCELYESVISCLQEIINTGEIDSLKAMGDLEKLVSTLQKSKDGSFSTQIFTWRFARRLIPNIFSAYIKRSDITGPLLEAFEQTAAELDVSLDNAKDQIGSTIYEVAGNVFRSDPALAITYEPIRILEDLRNRDDPSL